MKTTAIVMDDFFEDFGVIRGWATGASFGDVVNPADGVTYPGIAEVPGWLLTETSNRLRARAGVNPIVRTIFARLSTAGVHAPHQAHTDTTMGQYSLMVYLNKPEDCRGGTSMLRHIETGMERNPDSVEGELVWRRDTNRFIAWEPTLTVGMKSNRALMFDADLFHRAEPIGGFGSDTEDGRLVLIMFFDKGRL